MNKNGPPERAALPLNHGTGSQPGGDPMSTYPGVAKCRDRLHRAGWSIGETAIGPDFALVWCVTGTNGESCIDSCGRSQAEAWYRATLQAEAVGMLARPKGGECRWHARLTTG
jgi:hypothetical protein